MGADIRTIKLCRGSINKEQKTETAIKKEELTENFSGDYYMQGYIEFENKNSSLSEFSYVWNGDMDETTILSYVVYCGEAVIRDYEEKAALSYRGNPFTEREGLNCLSVIQVYITPEVLARMELAEDTVWADEIIMRPFIQDIYETLDIFYHDNPDCKFVARVYTMLSAGDFAVIVQSESVSVAYRISVYLRKKEAKVWEEKEWNPKRLEMYKTYTLLPWKDQAIKKEEESQIEIRGRYSNRYWGEQNKISKDWGKHAEVVKDMNHLCGEYDFSLRLPLKDYEKLVSYMTSAKWEVYKDEGDTIVDYMIYLLSNGYLSQVDKTYLFAVEEKLEEKGEMFVSKTIPLREDTSKGEGYFRDVVDRQIGRLEQLWKPMEEKLHSLYLYRRKLQQYFFMIKKLIGTCRDINELSDSRIYARSLAEQLEVVLRTAEPYVQNFDNVDTLEFMESYFQKAVITLNSFVGYIRNNNLQSLQTPDYNLESSKGMEKFLIGYSELVGKVMEYYYHDEKVERDRRYLPVVVSDLHDPYVNVEILFPAEEQMDYETYKKYRMENPGISYLMVVRSAAMREQVDMPVMICALCHEFAHQLRYEERIERNQVVHDIIVQELMSGIAEFITMNINSRVNAVFGVTTSLHMILRDSLKKAYKKLWQEIGFDYKDMPLEYLRQQMQIELERLINLWTKKRELRKRIREYYNILQNILAIDQTEVEDDLWKILDELDKVESSEEHVLDNTAIIQQISDSIFRISQSYAYNSLNDSDKEIVDENRFEAMNANGKTECWKCLFKGIKHSKNVAVIWREYRAFELWLYSEIKKNVDFGNITDDVIVKFDKEVYDCAQSEWEKYNRKSRALCDIREENVPEDLDCIPEYYYWTQVGRYLGLDYNSEENHEKFHSAMAMEMSSVQLDELFQEVNSSVELYREETADLFMCNIMNLSPFAYLNLTALLFVQEEGADKEYYTDDMDIERIFFVLYTKWCHSPEEKEAEKEFGRVCDEIHRGLKKYTCSMCKYCGEHSVSLVAKSNQEDLDCNNRSMEEINEKLNGEVDDILEWISQIEQAKDLPRRADVIGQLQNALRIYHILTGLRNSSSYLMMIREEKKSVIEDMVKGNAFLSKYFTTERDGMSPVIVEFMKIRESIAEFLQESYSQSGVCGNKDTNWKCAEFLIKLYYDNKVHIAQKKEATNDKGHEDCKQPE